MPLHWAHWDCVRVLTNSRLLASRLARQDARLTGLSHRILYSQANTYYIVRLVRGCATVLTILHHRVKPSLSQHPGHTATQPAVYISIEHSSGFQSFLVVCYQRCDPAIALALAICSQLSICGHARLVHTQGTFLTYWQRLSRFAHTRTGYDYMPHLCIPYHILLNFILCHLLLRSCHMMMTCLLHTCIH